MDKRKYRQPATLTALVIVLAIALYLQFFANSEPATFDRQVDEKRETTAIPEASEISGPDELPTPAQNTFPDKDGLFAMVEWRNRESPSHDEYPQSYAELRALAETGDVEATRRLTGLLRSCEAEFETFIDEWHSNVSSIAMKCNDVTLAQRNEADYWYGVLEAQGGVSAISNEAFRGMDHDMKIAYVDDMWALGDPHALIKYADIYGDHELQLIDPSARMKSYAYIYAFYEALIESAKYHSDADGLARLQWSQKRIRETHSAFLSEYELREAHELARQTVADNENCCIRLPPTLYRW